MPYYPPPPPLWARKPAPPASSPHPPALPDGLRQEFLERELGSGGAMFPPPTPQPTIETKPLVIEPPPWAGQTPVALPPEPEPDPPGTMGTRALAELMARDGEDAYDPPAFGPPVVTTPLVPFKPPEWPEEQRRQAELELQRAQQGIVEEHPAKHPPPRREPA